MVVADNARVSGIACGEGEIGQYHLRNSKYREDECKHTVKRTKARLERGREEYRTELENTSRWKR